MQALRTAATGMMAQQLNVEVISNNIANMSTTGYKRQRAEFQDLLYQNRRRSARSPRTPARWCRPACRSALGVKTGRHLPHHRAGQPEQTDNQLRPRDPRQRLLPGRSCRAARPPTPAPAPSRSRRTAASSPPTASWCSRASPIPAERHRRDDQLRAARCWPSSTARWRRRTCGQLQLATFVNEAGLEAIGDNLLLETARLGPGHRRRARPPGFGQVLQGFVEASNVNVVQEITALITAQRAYEMNSKSSPPTRCCRPSRSCGSSTEAEIAGDELLDFSPSLTSPAKAGVQSKRRLGCPGCPLWRA